MTTYYCNCSGCGEWLTVSNDPYDDPQSERQTGNETVAKCSGSCGEYYCGSHVNEEGFCDACEVESLWSDDLPRDATEARNYLTYVARRIAEQDLGVQEFRQNRSIIQEAMRNV